MSLFNPEYKFTCTTCQHVWYMTKKEIAEAHKNAQAVKQLEWKRRSAVLNSTVRKRTAQIAALQSMGNSDKKCPCCGAHHITKEKVK